MSSSQENYVTVQDLLNRYKQLTPDGIRWYLSRIGPLYSDSHFIESELVKTYNSEIVFLLILNLNL